MAVLQQMADTVLEFRRFVGLENISGSAGLDARKDVPDITTGAAHNHARMIQSRMVLDMVEALDTALVRQHGIENHEVRLPRFEKLDCYLAGMNNPDLITVRIQKLLGYTAMILVVIGNKNFRCNAIYIFTHLPLR